MNNAQNDPTTTDTATRKRRPLSVLAAALVFAVSALALTGTASTAGATPSTQSGPVMGVNSCYSTSEMGLVNLALAEVGVPASEFQKLSVTLLAFLVALNGGTDPATWVPTSGPTCFTTAYALPDEATVIDGLSDMLELEYHETQKLATLLTAFFVVLS